jgi:hypothetical protein
MLTDVRAIQAALNWIVDNPFGVSKGIWKFT